MKSISFVLPSDLIFVHPAVRQAESFARDYGVKDDSRISVVLRELLSNAIVHGNKNVPSRVVTCRIEYPWAGQFRITVEDEGQGFDFSCVNTSLPEDPRSVRNRGYVLVRNICSSIEFNDRGNRVTVLVGVDSADPAREGGEGKKQPGAVA